MDQHAPHDEPTLRGEDGTGSSRPWAARLFAELFAVDLRSLAAMRIAVGVLLIADLVTRGRHLVAHYTDLGALPADLVRAEYGVSPYFSVHWWLSGSPAAVACLFVVNGLAAALLAAGWRTRVMTAVCWLLLASLHVRSPLLQTAGDRTLQLVLFWSLFLPLGARWSLDAARAAGRLGSSNTHVSVAGMALLLQVCIIYWMTAVLKLKVPMWREGDGVAHALHVDVWVTHFGVWLRGFEGVLPALTVMVLFWELFGPVLPFVPGFTTPGRLIAIAGFLLMHLGFGLCFNLGVFPFLSVAAWLAFVPGPVWDRLASRTAADPGAGPLRARPWVNAVAACFFAFVCVLNLRPLHAVFRKAVPRWVERAGAALRLRQAWGMFTTEHALLGWYVVHGHRADGGAVSLLPAGGPATWERPEVVSDLYRTARWTHFLYGYPDLAKSPYWAAYGAYLCRSWNEDHEGPQRIERVTIAFMLREIGPLGGERLARIDLHEHDCGP